MEETGKCGLTLEWKGKSVWLNPPYGNQLKLFAKKLSEHKNGILLCPARTDSKWFHKYIFEKATLIFFLKGRIKFYGLEGYNKNACPFPICLVTYNHKQTLKVINSGIEGKALHLKKLNY